MHWVLQRNPTRTQKREAGPYSSTVWGFIVTQLVLALLIVSLILLDALLKHLKKQGCTFKGYSPAHLFGMEIVWVSLSGSWGHGKCTGLWAMCLQTDSSNTFLSHWCEVTSTTGGSASSLHSPCSASWRGKRDSVVYSASLSVSLHPQLFLPFLLPVTWWRDNRGDVNFCLNLNSIPNPRVFCYTSKFSHLSRIFKLLFCLFF